MSDREVLALKKRLVRTREAALFLDLAEGTLIVDRCTRRIGIPYLKIGGSVRYDLDRLEKFLESRKVEPVRILS